MRRFLIALVVVSVAGTVFAAPVAAKELILRDARGDMWQADPPGDSVKAPESQAGDITAMRVGNGRADVLVTLRYVDLRRNGVYANYTVRLQGGSRVVREVTVETSPGSWSGQLRVFRPNGDRVRACKATHKIDYLRNVLRVVVPRVCLHKPTFVRVNANGYRANDAGMFFTDNPHNVRDHASAWTRWVS